MRVRPLCLTLLILLILGNCKQAPSGSIQAERKPKFSISDILSLDYWDARKDFYESIHQGAEAEEEKNYAFAIGKYRKAYQLAPEHIEFPFHIATLYAKIASASPYALMEKEAAVRWLYRAVLVDPEMNTARLNEPQFKVLADNPQFQSLKIRLQKGVSANSDILRSLLDRVTATIQEMNEIMQEVGRLLHVVYRVSEFIGFRVVFFLFCVLGISVLLRQLGFLFSKTLWLVSFVCTVMLWHLFYRVISGGTSGGWETILRLSLLSLALVLLLLALRTALSWIFYHAKRLIKTSATYRRYVKFQANEKNRDLSKFLFDLEEASQDLIKQGHQYLASNSEEERRELLLEIETLKTKVSSLTSQEIKT